MHTELLKSDRGARWLIVDDEPKFGRAMHRLIGLEQLVTIAASEREARAALMAWDRWIGFFIDLRLGADNGLDVLSFARERHPGVPAAIVTGNPDPEVINRAFSLGAGFLCKPASELELMAFFTRCIAASRRLAVGPAALVEDIARAKALSRREAELLVLVVAGDSRLAVQRTMAISENTFKSHTRSLLRKVDASDLNEVVIHVLRAALDT